MITLLTSVVFTGSKDKTTFKEDIENSKKVQVYFNVTEIIDRESDRKIKQTNPKGQTDIRTTMPNEFSSINIKNNVITTLNTKMQVSTLS